MRPPLEQAARSPSPKGGPRLRTGGDFLHALVLVMAATASACDGAAAPAADGAAGGTPDAPSGPDVALASAGEIVLMAHAKPELGPAGSELVTMDLDGSNVRQLTDNDRMEFLPHFSPDGGKLLYTLYLTGAYGTPGAETDVAVYDLATGIETNLTGSGDSGYPVWSPDGTRIAFLRSLAPATRLWVMAADGSDAHEIGAPAGTDDDKLWGDIAWSKDDWILFVVAENPPPSTGCFKVRMDKIRPDGAERTKVSDGGPNCTPEGMEQSGDADPGFSADGSIIYTSRGFPEPPAGGTTPLTMRKLYAVSSDPWTPEKVETDLSLPSEPDCIEGVPKGSPDGQQVLLFRACFTSPDVRGGVYVTDATGSDRTWVADGFGPDWNPVVID